MNDAKIAADEANIRSAKAVAAASQMSDSFSIDGTDYTMAQVYKKAGATGGTMVFFTSAGTLSFDAGQAYAFQTNVANDEHLMYPETDHVKGAALAIWIGPGDDGKIAPFVTSNAG